MCMHRMINMCPMCHASVKLHQTCEDWMKRQRRSLEFTISDKPNWPIDWLLLLFSRTPETTCGIGNLLLRNVYVFVCLFVLLVNPFCSKRLIPGSMRDTYNSIHLSYCEETLGSLYWYLLSDAFTVCGESSSIVSAVSPAFYRKRYCRAWYWANKAQILEDTGYSRAQTRQLDHYLWPVCIV